MKQALLATFGTCLGVCELAGRSPSAAQKRFKKERVVTKEDLQNELESAQSRNKEIEAELKHYQEMVNLLVEEMLENDELIQSLQVQIELTEDSEEDEQED